MSARDNWSESPYGKAARENSIDRVRGRIREREREESERRCRCRWSQPGRRYLGVPLCALCQRLIYVRRRT